MRSMIEGGGITVNRAREIGARPSGRFNVRTKRCAIRETGSPRYSVDEAA